MTEFGRRIHMNSSFGTVHGRCDMMFVMISSVKEGQVTEMD